MDRVGVCVALTGHILVTFPPDSVLKSAAWLKVSLERKRDLLFREVWPLE